MDVFLRAFTDKDLPLYSSWLDSDHVKQWYSPVEDWLAEMRERDTTYSWIRHYIICADDTPIGFCQYYPYWKSGEEWNGSIPANGTYSIDYLIGDVRFLRKGCAGKALQLLHAQIFAQSDAQRIIVQPDEDNQASRKTLLSVGYVYDAKNDVFLLEC